MKTMKKLVSIVCLVALLMSTVVFTASAAYETPKEPAKWIDPNFETDVAYSFAFVGDTQYITCGDYYLGTNKLNTMYKYIADTADARKLEHVFILGDITDLGYKNDKNLAGSDAGKPGYGEWNIAAEAIYQLEEAGIPFSITRGNHDDYAIDKFFNVSQYTDQFKNCGGFFSDSNARWKDATAGESKYNVSRVPQNIMGYVYWNGVEKTHHTSSMVNSWKTVNIQGTDYLFITVDFNPTDNVLKWVDETLAKYPNHKAIITTHSYLNGDGELTSSDNGSTMYLFGNTATVLWDEVLSKHANVFMIVSGHTGGVAPTYSYNTGVNGNEVLQVLVDPQVYDAKEIDNKGTIEHGTQDTGLILYMNFSKDGKRINFDYYSPLLNKFLKGTNHTIYIEADEDYKDSKDTNLAGLEAYGQVNTYLSYKTANAPTLNGAIASGEYNFTRVTKADNNNLFESDLTEYFSYDDDYIYYAMSFKQTKAGQTMQMNFRTNYDWINKADASAATHWPRQQILFSLSDDGTLTTSAPGRMLSNNWGDCSYNMSVFRWNKDVFISGNRDSSTQINTIEIKIRKEFLDQNTPEKEIDTLGYVLYLGKNADGKEMWHRFSNATAANAALGNNWWMYEYMVFVDMDNPIRTRETASVRISDSNSGLRFKSDIDGEQLEYLKSVYSKVEIGTLIAPADLLGDKSLTHSFGVNGKDYIDVVADIDQPFATEADGTLVYAGSIVNINKGNLERDFTAVGYLKLTDKNGNVSYVYSETSATRNVDEVAEAAFFDIKAEAEDGYSYKITSENDVLRGFYSPYSEAQRAKLSTLMVNRDKNDPFTPDIFD